MSRAKQSYIRGCLKRSKHALKNVSSETIRFLRMSQAAQANTLGFLTRNEKFAEEVPSDTRDLSEDVSSETSNCSRMSPAK
eukprot:2772748-Pyramimonas_sp.AAC.1